MAKYPEIFTGGFRFIEKVEIDVIGGKTLISKEKCNHFLSGN